MLKPPQAIPQTQADWDRWARATAIIPDPGSVATGSVADKAITDAKLRDSAPASVIARLQSTPGTPGDLTSTTDDTFLARRLGQLGFSDLADSDIPATLARTADILALPDPFPQYLTQTEGDGRYALLPITGSATYDPPSLADGVGVTTTVTCTGVVLGGFARASFSLDLQGITVSAYVSAADTVSVRFQNESGGTLDLSSGTLRVRVEP